MKRYGHLFRRIVEWENLWIAARKSRRGKWQRWNVAQFEFDREWKLCELRHELLSGRYQPSDYRSFEIFEPKRRWISAAPYRDRVVHHAICQVIEPIFEEVFVQDSYACRKGKGTHAAIARGRKMAPQYSFVLQADIQQFFPTIDHGILLAAVERKIKDPELLSLLQRIILHPYPGQQESSYFAGDDLFTPQERSCGLPIGNQTSQFLANVMLNPLDQLIKRKLGRKAYVRYADDFLLFGNDRDQLIEDRERIREFLSTLRLRTHPRKCTIFPTKTGIPFLGFRIFPDRILLGSENIRKQRRRLKKMQRAYECGSLTPEEIRASVQAWWGHAQHADSWHLAHRLLSEYPFLRESQQAQDD